MYSLFDVYGLTPLIIAAQNGNSEVVALLLDSGADVNTRNDVMKRSAGLERVPEILPVTTPPPNPSTILPESNASLKFSAQEVTSFEAAITGPLPTAHSSSLSVIAANLPPSPPL
eukprot:gene27838-36662_t